MKEEKWELLKCIGHSTQALGLVFVLLITTIPVFAESIPFNLKVRGSMVQGLHACGEETRKTAIQRVVRHLAEELSGSRSEKTDSVVKQAGACCVEKWKFLDQPKDLGNGECESRVRVLVSDKKVESALRQYDVERVRKGKPLVIGTVIRYMLDGKLISKSKVHNPQDVISIFESEFHKFGYRTVNLTVLLEDFSLQRFGETCAIDGATVKDCTAFESYTDAVQTVLDRTRWALHYDIPDVQALEDDGWVAIGEVKVQRQGQDPSGLLYRADAHTNIRLYRVSNGEVLAVTPDQTALEKGDKQHIAVHSVAINSVGKTAERLAVRLHDHQKKLR